MSLFNVVISWISFNLQRREDRTATLLPAILVVLKLLGNTVTVLVQDSCEFNCHFETL